MNDLRIARLFLVMALYCIIEWSISFFLSSIDRHIANCFDGPIEILTRSLIVTLFNKRKIHQWRKAKNKKKTMMMMMISEISAEKMQERIWVKRGDTSSEWPFGSKCIYRWIRWSFWLFSSVMANEKENDNFSISISLRTCLFSLSSSSSSSSPSSSLVSFLSTNTPYLSVTEWKEPLIWF